MRDVKIKILLISATPRHHAGGRLETEQEFKKIKGAIQSAPKRDSFDHLQIEAAASSEDIQRALSTLKPHVAHFGGHGAREEGIVLEDEQRYAVPADSKALSNLFKSVTYYVRIIFLNACRTQPLAKALSRVTDYTIGTEFDIQDGDAITFSSSFYYALASGESVNLAFDKATTHLRNRPIPEGGLKLNVREGVNADEPFIEQVKRKSDRGGATQPQGTGKGKSKHTERGNGSPREEYKRQAKVVEALHKKLLGES